MKKLSIVGSAFFSAMAVSGALVATSALAANPIACADLKTKLSIADTTITLAELRPAGANPAPVGTIPVPICRVVGVTKPAVQFEVWMPSEGWNGKAITRAYYGAPAKYSYYVGCSKGGQQGLMEAQRYPEDFDGLIAGDPANNWTRFYAGSHIWYSRATLNDPESYIPASKTAILGKATAAACDAIDGIVDGVIDDPRKCKFDPAVLTCKAGQDPSTCFTPKQVQAIKKIWSGVRTPWGELVHPPLVPGAEDGPGGWAAWTTGSAPFTGLHWLAADGFFRYQVFENPAYDPMTFNFGSDLLFSLHKVGPSLDAVDPDLRPLDRRGAKLIVYHGFSDPDISPLNTINYFESVVDFMSHRHDDREDALERTTQFFRLFMVPGMQH